MTLSDTGGGFAAGTLIATEHGEAPVETLRARHVVRTVLGRGPVPVAALITQVGPAICIVAGALDPALPDRDLVLSADHAVFVDGALVPADHLVNGATVTRVGRPVPLWRLELATHDVVLAHGLAAESAPYPGASMWERAIGRTRFAGLPAPRADVLWRARCAGSCAPVVADPAALVPLRRRLHDRARLLGFRETDDAGLGLLASGCRLAAYWDGRTSSAVIPRHTRTLRLRSRSAVPREQNADVPDDRRLGVAVLRVSVDGVATPLDDGACGPGWHAPEPAWRWTSGNAVMRLAPAARDRSLTIETVPMLGYWVGRAKA